MKKTLLLTFATLTMVGCGGGGGNVDYLPFKAAENDNWGMVSPNGDILFDGEFTNEPSVVMGGVFRVLNADDRYEIFKAAGKPEQIGTQAYLRIGMFNESVTPAVIENEPIILIDKSGKQVAKLEKVNDKTVDKISQFADGYAVYITTDNKSGMVDTKGAVHIDAKYDYLTMYKDGMALGLINTDGDSEVYILDKGGKATLVKDTKDSKLLSYSGGIAIFKTNDILTGYNDKGEKTIKFDSKIKQVKPFVGDYAFFSDGDAWGLINKKGEITARAKYKSGNYVGKSFATFLNNDNKIVICDFDGTERAATAFSVVSMFYNDKNAFALEGKKWIVIDAEGKEASPNTFYAIGNNGMDDNTYYESDFIDFAAIAANVIGKITERGMAGFELGTSSKSVAEKVMPNVNLKNLKSNNNWSIENTSNMFSKELEGSSKVSAYIGLNFTHSPFSAIIERSGGWFSYTKTVGYKINDAATTNGITISLNLNFRHASKSAHLAKAASELIKASGLFNAPTSEDSSDGLTEKFVLKSNPNQIMAVSCSGENVFISYSRD